MRKGNLTSLEEEFVARTKNTSKKFIKLFERFRRFWRRFDGVMDTNHTIIIETLYFGEKVNLTLAAREVHVDDKTLYRYRVMYMKLYRMLLKEANFSL